MSAINPDITAALLARGLTDAFERSAADGIPVHQDSSMPPRLRRGLALLSGLCLTAGADDFGASVHVAMDRACAPFRDWGLPQFQLPFRYADVALIDRHLAMPTSDCREMALTGGSETAAQEEIQHEQLRAEVQRLPTKRRNGDYTAIREFVVRNPAVRYSDRERFAVERDLIPAARLVASFYRPVPQAALFGGAARLCAHCHSLLWPHRDTAAYPHGFCRVRECRLAHPTPSLGEEAPEPAEWQWATQASLAFWVGPGLDEIRIYDALKAAGRDAVLYPEADAADVGLDRTAVGINVKSYASPVVLGIKLCRSIGRLAGFRRRILALPDDKLRGNPRYLSQQRGAYSGPLPLQFMIVSEAIREFGR